MARYWHLCFILQIMEIFINVLVLFFLKIKKIITPNTSGRLRCYGIKGGSSVNSVKG
jgi:hypothetical protein